MCGRCNALNAAHNVGFNTFYWVGPLYDGAHPHSVLGGPGPPGPPQDRRHCDLMVLKFGYSESRECTCTPLHLPAGAHDPMGHFFITRAYLSDATYSVSLYVLQKKKIKNYELPPVGICVDAE
jgi:hypothetical protein